MRGTHRTRDRMHMSRIKREKFIDSVIASIPVLLVRHGVDPVVHVFISYGVELIFTGCAMLTNECARECLTIKVGPFDLVGRTLTVGFDLLSVIADRFLPLVVFIHDKVIESITTTITFFDNDPPYGSGGGKPVVNVFVAVVITIKEWCAIMLSSVAGDGRLLTLPCGVDKPLGFNPLPLQVSFPHKGKILVELFHIL